MRYWLIIYVDSAQHKQSLNHIEETPISVVYKQTTCETWDINCMSYASSTYPENYIPAVMPPLNHTSLPSMAATFLTTRFMAVLQPSGYSVFHGGDTPIQLSLPWWSCSCQCLNTETSARGNRGFTTETPSISYTFRLYIRLVVTL